MNIKEDSSNKTSETEHNVLNNPKIEEEKVQESNDLSKENAKAVGLSGNNKSAAERHKNDIPS